jgi:hypothetical protein
MLTFDTGGNIGWQEQLPNANGRKGTPQEINFFFIIRQQRKFILFLIYAV